MSSSSVSSTKSAKAPKRADSGKPKRPLTAYNIFFKEQRHQILSHGKSGGFAELARTIASRWKSISPAEHQDCHEKAAQDKLRYQKEMEIWSAKHPPKDPVDSSQGRSFRVEGNCSVGSQNTSFSLARAETGLLQQQAFLQKRSFSTGSYSPLSSSKPSSKDIASLEDLILLRVKQQAQSLYDEQQKEKSHIALIGGQAVKNDLLEPLPLEQLQTVRLESTTARPARRSSAPASLREVFDEAWVEPSWNFDLDGVAGDLFAKMQGL